MERLLSPVALAGMEIPNRIFMPSMGTYYTGLDGAPTPRLRDFYLARARGGVGLIVTEIHAVERRGRSNGVQLGLWRDDQADALRPMVEAIKAEGTRVVAQLGHAGRQTTAAVAGESPVAPSGGVICERYRDPPRALETTEIAGIVGRFAAAAGRAIRAGYDGVEIHGAHGFLVAQFLSRFTNLRQDGYGGALTNRARFGQEVVAAIRAAIGPGRPLIVRLSAEEGFPGGLLLSETCRIAALLEEAGADALDISAGIVANRRLYCAPAAIPHGHLLRYARAFRASTRMRIMLPGRITTARLAEQILEEGAADLIGMARALLVEPQMPRKIRRAEPVRICVGCHQGCRSHPISCMINPALGREGERDVAPPDRPRRVTILGGGPAGLECARIAALRGHRVILHEREERLGGQLWLGGLPPAKAELLDYLDFQEGELRRLGVDIRMRSAPDRAAIGNDRPDVVVLATGARQKPMRVKGADRAVTAEQVLRDGLTAASAIVIGAGETGAEVADHLRAQGTTVTLIGSSGAVAAEMQADPRHYLMDRLGGVQVRLRMIAEAITETGVIVADGVRRRTLSGDLVVLATGIEPTPEIGDAFSGPGWVTHVIGDAARIGDAKAAILEGYRVGAMI